MGGGRGVGRRGEERGGEGERTSGGEREKEGRIRAEGERRGREEMESGEQLHMRFQHSVSCDISPINPLSANVYQ